MKKVGKVKVLEPKIKIIKEISHHSKLEEEIAESDNETIVQAASDLSSPVSLPTPLQNTSPTSTEEPIEREIERPRISEETSLPPTRPVNTRALYEIGKDFGGSSPKYEDVNAAMKARRINPTIENNPEDFGRRTIPFENEELNRLRSEPNARGYEVQLDSHQDIRVKTRRPSEG